MRISRLVLAALILGAPGIVLAPVWRISGLGAGEDDILYYYPSRSFFAESVAQGQMPWLNPWTGLGRPFAADPQSALWYPFTWLFAVATPGWAYPASLWLHYSLALWGMYRLLRSMPLSRQAAVFGGIAFAFCGFMLAHRAHFAMQNAGAWAPWVLWRLRRYAEAGGNGRLIAAAAVATLQCLAGHTQIAAMTALASLVYVATGRGPALAALRRVGVVWLCTAGLFAVQWMPTFAYVRECTRLRNMYWDFTQNSWNPTSALTIIMPMLLGQRTPDFFPERWWGDSHQVEQFAYAGILPLVLAALAFRNNVRADARRRAFAVVGLLGILLALGKFGPLCPVLYWLPGASLFRVPARALVLFNLALAALAAFALHDLSAPHTPQRVRLRAAALAWTRRPLAVAIGSVLLALVLVVLAMPFCDAATRRAALRAISPMSPAVWVPVLVIGASLTALGIFARRWRERRPAWPLTLVVLLDFVVMGWTIDSPAGWPKVAEVLNPPAREAWLRHVRGSPHRLWVVTRDVYAGSSIKGVANTNMLAHVASLTDYGPLQPSIVYPLFEFAPWGVTSKAEELLADTSWMRAYNVGWVLLCEREWPAPADCRLVATTPDGMRLYRCAGALGEAFIERGDDALPVAYASDTPDRVVVRLGERLGEGGGGAESREERAPARLVLSRVRLAGWTARADGGELPIETAHGALMAVRMASGVREVEWVYRTPGLQAGALVSAATVLLLGAACVLSGRSRRGTGVV